MKKILLSLITIFTLTSFNLAFAENKVPNDLKVEIKPLSAGLKAKAYGIHGTDVAVINYATPYTIHVTSPANFYLDERTSGRIVSDSVFNPYVVVRDDDDCTLIFAGNVDHYATISVYYTNGRFSYNVTNN
jgi:hypothetical protein